MFEFPEQTIKNLQAAFSMFLRSKIFIFEPLTSSIPLTTQDIKLSVFKLVFLSVNLNLSNDIINFQNINENNQN